MLLHIFRHIDADHRLLAAKHHLGEYLGQLRLADAGRTKEQEGTDRARRVLQTNSSALDRLRHRRDRLILSDHTLMQRLLQLHQPLRLLLRQPLYRNLRPHGYDLRDIRLADLLAADAALLCQTLLRGCQFFERRLLRAVQRLRLLPVSKDDRLLFLLGKLIHRRLQLLYAIRHGSAADLLSGRCFIDEVDCLIRQVAVADIARGIFHCRIDRLVRDLYLMVRLVVRTQSFQNSDRILLIRLLHGNGLESALQRRVFFNIFAVLRNSRRTNQLHLAARERRF